jgi:hypothetical protein
MKQVKQTPKRNLKSFKKVLTKSSSCDTIDTVEKAKT